MSTLLKELSIDDAQVAAKSTRTRLFNIFATTRFQLAMAAFAGVVLPGLIRVRFENWADEVLSYDANVWGACVAILAGFLIHRKLTSLPGTAALSNTLPGFVLSYLTVMALFSALRIDFSRTQLVLSMIMVCVLFLALSYIEARLKTQMNGFVPGGRADELKKIIPSNSRSRSKAKSPLTIFPRTLSDTSRLTRCTRQPNCMSTSSSHSWRWSCYPRFSSSLPY